MPTALEEKADAYELRGPNSKTTALASAAAREECSRRRPLLSNVSDRSHSRRAVEVAQRGAVSWMLKQASVRTERTERDEPDWARRSESEGRSEWGVGVVR